MTASNALPVAQRIPLADGTVIRLVETESGTKAIIEQESIDSGSVFVARNLARELGIARVS